MLGQMIEICGKKVFIPQKLLKKYQRHDSSEWVSIYYYKKKSIPIHDSQIKDNIEEVKYISSRLDYRKGVFYKMSQASYNDYHFDYYFKLKDNAPNLILSKTKKSKSDYQNQYALLDIEHKYKDGKILLEFD